MEELVLTDPVVEPEKVTSKFRVIALMLNNDTVTSSQLPGIEPGQVVITLRDNFDKQYTHQYLGQQAMDYIKFINTANFSTKSLHKRILERLSTEGKLPGTVVGAPDPATPPVFLEDSQAPERTKKGLK